MLRSHSLRAVVIGSALFISASVRGAEPAAVVRVAVPAVHEHPNVNNIVSTAVSPDGRSVYAVEFPDHLTVLHREPGSNRIQSGMSMGRSPNEDISQVIVSPDGRYVVTTGLGGTVLLYSRTQPDKLDKLDELTGRLEKIADWWPSRSCFSPDSNFLLVTDYNGLVHTFLITAEGKFVHRQSLDDEEGRLAGANSIVVHPDGMSAIVLCPGARSIIVLDRNPFDGTMTVRHGYDAEQAALNNLDGAVDLLLSADGRFAYVSSGNFRGKYALSVFQLLSNGRIRLIQELLDGNDRIRDAHRGYDLALSPDGTELFLTSKLHDTLMSFQRHPLTGRLMPLSIVYRNPEKSPKWPTGLSVSSDGYLFAGTERGNALLVVRLVGAEIAAERTVDRLKPQPSPTPPKPAGTKPTVVKPADAKPTETKPTTPKPSGNSPAPPQAQPSVDDEAARMTGHRYEATDAAFSPDGRRLVSGGADSTIRIWDAKTATGIREISTTASLDVAWSPNGNLVASCGRDGDVVLWDPDTGASSRTFRIRSRLGHGLTFSPDGNQLLTSSRGAVTLWNVADGKEVRTYKQEMEIVNSVAFSPDGKLAACCGGYFNNSETPLGPILRVWRLDDGEVLFSRRTNIRSAIRAVTFSPDGRFVAGADLDDRGIGVWDWEKGERVKFFDNQSGTPYELRFMKSGNFLVAAQAGGVVIYDMATAKKVFSYGGNAGGASAVDISPDGSFAVSANSDKTIRLWRVPEPIRATVPPRKP